MRCNMYDTFREMISQIFNEPDFVQFCYIEGRETKCICSSINDGMVFTEAGMVDEVNFTLDIEIATLDRLPKQNDKVVFRQQTYKISHIETDSANCSLKLYLIALSKGK